MPRVSVIIPAHNAAAHLGETLDSVLAQTYEDREVVVADDASTDATFDLASGFAEGVRCVRSATNLGPAGARNLAIDHAGGELLALLDADDLWLPGYLDEQVALYDREQQRAPGVGIVCCDAFELVGDSLREQTYAQRVGTKQRPTLTSLLHRNTIFVSALVPRAIVEETGGFSTECWGSEDHDLWLRIVELGYRVVVNPRPLAIYRVAEGSVSSDVLGMSRTTQTTYRRALQRGGLSPLQCAVVRRYLRVQIAVERWEQLSAQCSAGTGRPPVGAMLRAAPTLAGVVLEHPNRWLRWARQILAQR